jgi:hypothetical protein
MIFVLGLVVKNKWKKKDYNRRKLDLDFIMEHYNQGCHADVFRRTDGQTSGRSDDGRGGVRDLDAL